MSHDTTPPQSDYGFLSVAPRLRRIGLIAHIGTSVGWLGAVLAFLALSIAGVNSTKAETIRSAYVAMNLIGAFVIVPLSFASLGTGILQAFGTQWGLLRYHWVFAKFVLTVGATALLLLHQFTAVAAAVAASATTTSAALPTAGRVGVQLVLDSALGILVLLIATALSVFKPWGRIRWSRTQIRIWLAVLLSILAAIIVRHLSGGRHSQHGA